MSKDHPVCAPALANLVGSLVSCVLVCAFVVSLAFGQTPAPCQAIPTNATPDTDGKPSGWAQNATVTVYTDTTQYNAEQRAAIKAGFNNWAHADNANVTYNFVEQSGPPASPTGNYVIVKKEDPPKGPLAAEVKSTTIPAGSIHHVDNATMRLGTSLTDPTAMLTPMVAHETGHLHFLGNCSDCATGTSVMSVPVVAESNTGPTPCDAEKSNQTSGYQALPPLPGGGEEGCPPDDLTCQPLDPWCCSPIILALGRGADYHLVAAQEGVWFDIDADGISEQLGWTRGGEPIGFLALDRNQNGVIDNGRELFGNYTPLEGDQTAAHGFEALAHWDHPQAGGNGDGWIDSGDAVWSRLLVWIDANHDGFSQSGELFHPSQFSISGISVLYGLEMRRDPFGNLFRLRAEFIIGYARRMAYDVFFTTQ